MWLFDTPYVPTVILESPPDESGSLEFATFAVVGQLAIPAGSLGGRPVGTGTFSSREEFLRSVRRAAEEVRERRGRVTQHEVAEMMAFRDLLGPLDPSRQLRRLTDKFGFFGWSDLINQL